MRLHYLRGDRAAARAAYERLRRLLDDELGAAPDRETRELAALIERSVPPPLTPARALPPAVLRPPRLVGREPQWAVAQAAWQDGEIVCVVGEAGIGKSRFLGDFAAAQAPSRERRGAAWRRPGALCAARPPAACAARAAARCRRGRATSSPACCRSGARRRRPGPTRSRCAKPPAAWLTEAAAEGPLTLVLDDLHFADAATLETLPALMAAPGLHWLLGSRPAGEAGADAAAAIAALATLDRPPLRRIELTPLDRQPACAR